MTLLDYANRNAWCRLQLRYEARQRAWIASIVDLPWPWTLGVTPLRALNALSAELSGASIQGARLPVFEPMEDLCQTPTITNPTAC